MPRTPAVFAEHLSLLAFGTVLLACTPYGDEDINAEDSAMVSGGASTNASDETGGGTSASTTTGTTGMDDTGATTTGDGSTSSGGFVPDGGGASCGEECDIWNPDD